MKHQHGGEPAGGESKKAMIYHDLLSGRDLASEKSLLDVLDLLAHLFDQHFQLNGGVRHFGID